MKATLFAVGCMALLGTRRRNISPSFYSSNFLGLRVHSLQHTRLLAFQLLVTLQVLLTKIDSKLEMLAAVGNRRRGYCDCRPLKARFSKWRPLQA